MIKLKLLLWGVGVLLLAGAIVMLNLAIMYSSEPHYRQMGWALFCSVNAIWVGVLGVICFIAAESHQVAMRQLDWDERAKVVE